MILNQVYTYVNLGINAYGFFFPNKRRVFILWLFLYIDTKTII